MVRDSRVEPSTLRLDITDGPYLRSEPSTIMPHITDGPYLKREPSTLMPHITDSSGTLLHFFRITATTDRQAGLTQSPAQPCRIVAAGDALEATEKGPHNLRI